MSDIDAHRIFSDLNYGIGPYQLKLLDVDQDRLSNKVHLRVVEITKREITNIDIPISFPNIIEKERFLANFLIYQNIQENAPINLKAVFESDEANMMIGEHLSRASKYQYDALALSGGGAKGIIYPGVITGLGDIRLRNIKDIAGCSAGSVIAGLLACGIRPNELNEFGISTNLKMTQAELRSLIENQISKQIRSFLDDNDNLPRLTEFANEPAVRNILKLYQSRELMDITFEELHVLSKVFPDAGFKNLSVIAVHFDHDKPTEGTIDYATTAGLLGLGKPTELHLSYETVPNMPISIGILASSALPGVFPPVDATAYFPAGAAEHGPFLLRDGGILNNIPHDVLLRNPNVKNTLVLAFDSSKDAHKKERTHMEAILDFMATVPNSSYLKYDIKTLEQKHPERLHYMETLGIGTTDFEKATQTANMLMKNGKDRFIEFELTAPYTSGLASITDLQTEIHNRIKIELMPTYFESSLGSAERRIIDHSLEQLETAPSREKFQELLADVQAQLEQARESGIKAHLEHANQKEIAERAEDLVNFWIYYAEQLLFEGI